MLFVRSEKRKIYHQKSGGHRRHLNLVFQEQEAYV